MKNVFRKKIGLVVVALILLLAGCKKNTDINSTPVDSEESEVSSSIPVTAIKVESSDFYEYGEYYGRVQGVKRSSIINILGGTVESVDVVEGSKVATGDSLAKISSEKAKIALDSAKLNEKISRDNYNTQRKFLKSGNSSQISVDQAHLKWLTSKTQLIDAQKAYDAAFCIAQIDGTVVLRNINRDEEISAGQNTFLIEDMSQIEIEIGIPEGDMDGVTEGSRAQVTIDLYPGRVWDGELTRHSRRSSDRNLTFSATILVDNSDGKILSGTTAKVKLLRNSYEDSVVIPANSVINDSGETYVMVLAGDKVKRRTVTLGPRGISNCVVASGLEVGETIVQEGLHLLVDSQKVYVVNKGV